MIHEFDATEEQPQLEIKKGSKTRTLDITLMDRATFKKLNAIEAKRQGVGQDLDAQLDLLFQQVKILAPTSKESDFRGMSLAKLLQLVQTMTEISMGTARPPEEKKRPEPRNTRSSRSRKRASA